MKILPYVVAAIVVAIPAHAATIVWIDEGTLDVSAGALLRLPPVGTPWSLQVTFDSDAVGTPRGGPPGTSCVAYPIQSEIFTLGGFTYTGATGQIVTNFNHIFGCGRIGDITLEMGAGFPEPGAWDLSWLHLRAAYRDAIHRDLSLPTTPTLSGFDYALSFYDTFGDIRMQDHNFQPRLLVDSATPVPEPGTLIMVGIGLALAGKRRLWSGTAQRQ
jgi:hypothetical protein